LVQKYIIMNPKKETNLSLSPQPDQYVFRR
jgi:hypothetical protein